MHHCVPEPVPEPGVKAVRQYVLIDDDHQGYIVCGKLGGEWTEEGSLNEGKSRACLRMVADLGEASMFHVRDGVGEREDIRRQEDVSKT